MNAVGYVRLSRDEDRSNYTSIEAQKQLILEYAKKNNMVVSKIYIDDNVSGYTLNRPAFGEMLDQIENGYVDAVIAKDLSRIGRNNGKVLVLIERFKELNKHMILINEGNDGLDILEDDSDILGIKTWYNEMYVKDISRKIRANMRSMQMRGTLIMGNYYGYEKDKNDKAKLIVEEELRPFIQLIFKLYLNGFGYKKICDILNEKSIPTPSAWAEQKHKNRGRIYKLPVSKTWQPHNICRIIDDDIYIGTLRTHKKVLKNIKGREVKIPKADQYVFPNHHEAIVSEEDFKLAQEIKSKKSVQKRWNNSSKNNYLFGGLIKCGGCGKSFAGNIKKRKSGNIKGYNCTNYTNYGNKLCSNHFVDEELLIFFLKELLKAIKENHKPYLNTININYDEQNSDNKIKHIQKELGIISQELKLLINQKIKDIMKETEPECKKIIETSYEELEREKKNQIRFLKEVLNQINMAQINSADSKIKSGTDIFDEIINQDKPSRKLIEMLIDKIIIDDDGTVRFYLKVNLQLHLQYKG